MKKYSVLFLIIALLLIGCQSSASEPMYMLAPTSPPATEVAVEESTQESVQQAQGSEPAALTANPWQWVSFTNPVE